MYHTDSLVAMGNSLIHGVEGGVQGRLWEGWDKHLHEERPRGLPRHGEAEEKEFVYCELIWIRHLDCVLAVHQRPAQPRLVAAWQLQA